MKKSLIIGLIVALVLILVGGAGIVYARVRGLENNATVTVTKVQNGNKIVRQFGYGPGGMMGGDGYGPGGTMDGYGPGQRVGPRGVGPGMQGGRGSQIARDMGIMHDYMISAFAKAVGLTVEEVDTQLANGETPKEIAIAQGTAEADLPALWSQVHQAALDQAVADGVITQAQADRMLQQMNEYSGLGFGPGFGLRDRPMWDRGDVQP
ncbi:MAG: hypothetical protein WAV05_17060 [Anaerolineales bacterium]